MRRYLIAFTILVLSATLGIQPQQALSQTEQSNPNSGTEGQAFAPGRIIVKAEEEAPADAVASLNRENEATLEEEMPHSEVQVVDLPENLSVAEAVERYEDSPLVEYAEPDYLVDVQNEPVSDTYYSKLWGLNNTGQVYRTESSGTQHSGTEDADIDAPEAWRGATGNADTVVAVIDTGVDINHPDLDANVWTNPDEIAGNGVDDDRNGYVDDVHGWDFFEDNASVFDSVTADRHGTHVAGTIAAEKGNGIAVTGVAPRAKVVPLKFIGPRTGYISDAIAALDYAVAEGVKISNNSWGCSCPSQALFDALTRAGANGHLFVVAAENGGDDNIGDNNDHNPVYPASYGHANIISVAASDHSDELTSFSNYGARSVDLAAPGQNILSTLPGNHVGFFYGTSMATPHVAGTAALVKDMFPILGDAGIKAKILSSVDQKPALLDKTVSGGRLNAAKAVGLDADLPSNEPPKIGGVRPTGKIRDASPHIRTTVSDAEIELTKADIEFYVDGKAKPFEYNASTDKLSYRSGRLSPGRHTVKIAATDTLGLKSNKSSRFKVVR